MKYRIVMHRHDPFFGIGKTFAKTWYVRDWANVPEGGMTYTDCAETAKRFDSPSDAFRYLNENKLWTYRDKNTWELERV